MSCVLKCPINLITNPNPIYSHSITWQYEACLKSSQNLSTNNIFLYLQLTKYYPLQNSPIAQKCTSPTTFFTSASNVRSTFKSFVTILIMSSTVRILLTLRVILSLGNRKELGGGIGQVNRGGFGRLKIECFVNNCLIDNAVWTGVMEKPASISKNFRLLTL
jgi:hypothetical protein